MKMTTLKTIMISAAMLLAMGLVAVPQAMAGGSVFATYKLPFGLQLGKPVPEKIKPHIYSEGEVFNGSSYPRSEPKNIKIYKRGSLGVQALSGRVSSVLFFEGKYPREMKGLLSKGMSAEKLKRLLRQQGGQEITTVPYDTVRSNAFGFVSAVFGSYQYVFNIQSNDGEKTGLTEIEISEYLDDY